MGPDVWWAVLAAELAAIVVVAVALHGERLPAEHRPPARTLLALLLLAVAVDVLIAVGDCRILGAPRAALGAVVPCVPPAPRSSLTSAVRLSEQALVMAWPAALTAGAWAVFSTTERPLFQRLSRAMGGRSAPAAFALAWAVAVVVLVLGRPYGHPGDTLEARQARAEVVARLLLGVDLLAVAAGAAAVVCAWTPGRRWARSPAHVAVLSLLVTEAAVALIGPYVRDPFADWDYARALYLSGFLGVAVAFWRALRGRSGRPAAAP